MNLAGLKSSTRAILALLHIGALSLTSCTLKETVPDKPYPSESRTSRSFFETRGKDGRAKLRTFLAGWSPEMTTGEYQDEIMDHFQHAGNANIVFEITENNLVGKLMNASYMSDAQDCLDRDSIEAINCRARWTNVITIPITKHFYFERSKDSRGRQTDQFIENDQRSHWSARPYMNLSLGGLSIKDWAMKLTVTDLDVQNVEAVEWDFEKPYLAFTLTATDAGYGSFIQGRFRFNFLAFEHNPKFEKTPYRPANAKSINAVRVIGKLNGGDQDNPILYAAHWDTSVKHRIALYGFPKEYEHIGFDVVETWNAAFEKIGRGRPFEAFITDREYAFDLRNPSMTWISDKRLAQSYNAPMGIAMMISDVRNGEILWGNVNIFAGQMEAYINRNSPNSGGGGADSMTSRKESGIQLSLMEPEKLTPSMRTSIPQELMNSAGYEAVRSSLMRSFGQEYNSLKQYSKQLDNMAPKTLQEIIDSDSELNPAQAAADSSADPKKTSAFDINKIINQRVAGLDELLNSKTSVVEQMSRDLVALSSRFQQLNAQLGSSEKVMDADFVQKLIHQPKLSESLAALPTFNRVGLHQKLSQNKNLSRSEMIEFLNAQPHLTGEWSPNTFDIDNTFGRKNTGWAMAIGEFNLDKREAFRSVMRTVLLHEIGHFLGLGHNFKENILPEAGSLPNSSKQIGWVSHKKYIEYSREKLEKDAKNHFKNYTTVMGYPSGESEVLIPYDDWMVGPGDLLSLHYLYNKQYPVYAENSNGGGDFQFEKIGVDGIIREQLTKSGRNYKVAYFPSCDDLTATYTMDPYCARWDRGYDAPTLMENYFTLLKGNLVTSLNAFSNTVKGGDFDRQEAGTWKYSLFYMARARVFYDYMRQKYENDIRALINSGDDGGIQNLLDFSDSCQKAAQGEEDAITNAHLKKLFTDPAKQELRDLCVANAKMISHLESVLQLPGKDYTQIDYMDRYVSWITGPGMKQSVSRAFGSWKEMARIPLKISALMTLTSPYPYMYNDGWVWPILRYSREDGSYHISTLYPKEYTSAVASATEMNLNLGTAGLDQTTSIGRSVMAMGYFLNNSYYSNDILKVSQPFIENVRNQTQFRYSIAMIDVQRKDEEGKELARKFTAVIHNQYSVGPETVPEIYMYKDNRTVIMPPPRSLLLPLSSIRWYSPSSGYYFAIKLDYADDYFDRLKSKSVRKTLEDMYYETMKKCVQGDNRNGLRFFFNDSVSEEVFPGFTFPKTIAEARSSDQNKFFSSIDEMFRRYHADPKLKPNPSSCDEALRGQGLLVMAASVLNGFYLGNVGDFMEKSNAW